MTKAAAALSTWYTTSVNLFDHSSLSASCVYTGSSTETVLQSVFVLCPPQCAEMFTLGGIGHRKPPSRIEALVWAGLES